MKTHEAHIKEIFYQEKAKEIRMEMPYGAVGTASPTRASALPLRFTSDGHESVSNNGSHAEAAPSFGSMGRADSESSIEVVLPPAAVSTLESLDQEMLLDAYWASFGTAETRAVMRNPLARDSLQEVVIGVDERIEVTNTSGYPWRCIASLLITAADGSNWIGTAWLVSPRLLLTAGHCVFIRNRGGWVREIEVIPGRRGSEQPNGSCIATNFRSVRGWTQDADREFDYAAILLPEDCRMGDQLGWFGFESRTDSDLNNLTVNISGYPGDKPVGTQWFHSNVVTGVNERVITYQIDTAGGQSGAPVWVMKPGNERYGVGIHTNGALSGNSATRITDDVYNNIVTWRDEVP